MVKLSYEENLMVLLSFFLLIGLPYRNHEGEIEVAGPSTYSMSLLEKKVRELLTSFTLLIISITSLSLTIQIATLDKKILFVRISISNSMMGLGVSSVAMWDAKLGRRKMIYMSKEKKME